MDRGRGGGGGRGRNADAPHHIPWRGWRDVLVRTAREFSADRVTLVAAGLSFYAMLAVFPALVAIVSIYGLVADPADVERQIESIGGALPDAARTLILRQLTRIVSSSSTALSWGVVLSMLGLLWSATSGTRGLISALNLAYGEPQRRGLIKSVLVALAFTIGFIVAAAVAVFAITALPRVIEATGLGDAGATVVSWLRWPALFVLVLVGLALLYHLAPDRQRPRFRWVTVGAPVAATLWTGASLLFSWYSSSFAKFNETYGALGGVIVLLMWFYISGIAILIGAELNAEVEHQTRKDTTVGAPAPMGERGAHVADTVGEATGGSAR